MIPFPLRFVANSIRYIVFHFETRYHGKMMRGGSARESWCKDTYEREI
jgi:hypothetical protein